MQEMHRDGYVWICRPFFTTKNGKRIWAHHYGKKAFCFWAKVKT